MSKSLLNNNLFITDHIGLYEKCKGTHKVFIQGPTISKCNFISENEVNLLNQTCHSIEVTAGEALLDELNKLSLNLSKYSFEKNIFCEKLEESLFIYGTLFPYFKFYARKKYIFSLWFKKVISAFDISPNQILINLHHDFHLLTNNELVNNDSTHINISFHNIPKPKSTFISKVKNTRAFLLGLIKKQVKAEANQRLLILLYKLPHHVNVFKTFFKIAANSGLAIDIVWLDFKDYFNPELYLPAVERYKNIRHFEFKDFRTSHSISHERLYKSLENINPAFSFIKNQGIIDNQEKVYASMNNIFSQLKPTACLQMTNHEIGRTMTQVARYYNTPSIQVDYALSSDYFAFQSLIKYTVKASISQAVIDLWKRRKDPSLHHIPIGFCKHDNISLNEELLNHKQTEFKKIGLNPGSKTVFFASTITDEGSIYGLEKQKIIESLSTICHQNNWNLLIKKHPLESDNYAKSIISNNAYPFQVALEHTEINLTSAISWSDVTTTQGSSIILESCFYNKLFCFLSTSQNAKPILAGYDPEVNLLFKNMNNFEKFLIKYFTDPNLEKKYKHLISKQKSYLLFKTDRLASKRLLSLVKGLSEHKLNGSFFEEV